MQTACGYQMIDDTPVISVNQWRAVGLTKNMFEHDSKSGYLSIFHRSVNGETLIDVRSIKRPDRLRIIEEAFGKIPESPKKSVYRVEIDTAARTFYETHSKPDGTPLSPEKITEYTNRASIFNALKKGMQIHTQSS